MSLVDFLLGIENEIRLQAGLDSVTLAGSVLEPLPPNTKAEYYHGSSSDSSDSSSSSGAANRAIKFYPSVDSGPISIVKASLSTTSGFTATPLAEAIRSSVEFCSYCDQHPELFASEFDEMVDELKEAF